MKNYSKYRKNDERHSSIVSDFLDKKFYNIKTKKPIRYDTLEEQVKGIDIAFDFNDVLYTCDEKAATNYVNKKLNTFSLELSFIDRGNNLHDGWLFDEKKVNNSFLFVWIDEAVKEDLESVDDIVSLEIALVKRSKIIDYLSSIKWDKARLIKKMMKMRENPNEYKGNIYKYGCKFSYSENYVEKPINVLLPREKLKELSDYTEILTK